MALSGLDHVAVPIGKVDEMLAFYRKLDFPINTGELNGLRYFSVHIGEQRFNFHHPELWRSPEFTLRAPQSEPGCGDFCFVWDRSLRELQDWLQQRDIEIELGPVARTGGRSAGSVAGQSLYTRDPDGNLLEFIVYPG